MNRHIGISTLAVCAAATLSLLSLNCRAADIVNGWSPTTTITSVYSVYSVTMFKLSGTTQTCGHPDYWQLPLIDTIASKAKHALLIAAFAAGKQVSLRCENGLVSDFQVFN